MTDAVTVALIVSVPTILSSLAGIVVAVSNAEKIHHAVREVKESVVAVKTDIIEVKHELNSALAAQLKTEGDAKYAAGQKQERDVQERIEKAKQP